MILLMCNYHIWRISHQFSFDHNILVVGQRAKLSGSHTLPTFKDVFLPSEKCACTKSSCQELKWCFLVACYQLSSAGCINMMSR